MQENEIDCKESFFPDCDLSFGFVFQREDSV
jgi:hypothetical protein